MPSIQMKTDNIMKGCQVLNLVINGMPSILNIEEEELSEWFKF